MTQERPNVLIILTDDQGYGDMSCHGHPVLRTPNIDRLHDESVRLTDFHVAPMCAPTRGEIMSGVHCLRNGAMATSLARHLLKPELPTMADLLAADGYATGIFGKWHLGDSYPYRPMDRGFQEAIYHHGFGLAGADAYWENDYLNPHYRHNGVLEHAEGYCTDFWFDSAMAWMAEQHEQGRPFLCYIPTNVPHFPMWVDDVYKEEFAAYGGTPSGFFGMIVELDENLARLEKFLRENDLRDNTILIFMTDNGHAGGALDVYNAHMRGGKCSRYDGGHRVPCFIRWPGGDMLPPGDLSTPTQATDILPMLLELCGIDAPEGAAFDGESLAPLLRGEPHELDDRMFVVQYFQNSIGKDDASVIWKQWRLVFGNELYDIHRDRGAGARRLGRAPGGGRRYARFLRAVVGRARAGDPRLQPPDRRLGAPGSGDAHQLRVGECPLRRRRQCASGQRRGRRQGGAVEHPGRPGGRIRNRAAPLAAGIGTGPHGGGSDLSRRLRHA